MHEFFLAMDPRSIILLAGVMNLVMGVVLYALRRGTPTGVAGLREWALAPFASLASTLLFGLRGVLPEALSITVANMVLFVSILLYFSGSLQFLGQRRLARKWWCAIVVAALPIAWFSAVEPRYDTRLGIITTLVAITFLLHARLYIRAGIRTFGQKLMVFVLLVQATVPAARLVTVLDGEAGSGLLDKSWIQSLYIATFSFAALLLSIACVVMATERVREEFEALAARDSLTGILNRGAWMKVCKVAWKRCAPLKQPLAVMMLDADHFKTVNDTYGHQFGDAMLREWGARLAQPLRHGDHLGRYGGEEFAIVLPMANAQQAFDIAERLRTVLAEPFDSASDLARRGISPCTASIGIAVSRGASEDVDHLMGRADAALYRAKDTGRNRVELAE
jgi:diguanylate cyclase (GGDEF)-like protein